jgi:hypothetical protein
MPESRLALEEAADFITANIKASDRMHAAPGFPKTLRRRSEFQA